MIRNMARVPVKFIIGPKGKTEAVQLGVSEYRRLIRRLEDLEDAVTLDRAEETSKGLIPYSTIRKRSKRPGKW
jgi:hypothetical protein